MTLVLHIAMRIVRGWTFLYTSCLPSAKQLLRRNAIDSDLWEYLHDPDRNGTFRAALHVLGRAIRGVPDDLQWSIEQVRISYLPCAAVTVIALVIVVARQLSGGVSMPPVPPLQPPVIVTLDTPPPPPPPPEKQGGHDRDYWRNRP
jgi:hypothetical protein